MEDKEVIAIQYRKISELEEENKNLKERVSELEDVSEDYDILSKDFIALWEENENLKKERDLYKARNEELNENCFWLSKENEKLKEEVKKWKMVADENGTHYDMLEEENKKLKNDLETVAGAYFDR